MTDNDSQSISSDEFPEIPEKISDKETWKKFQTETIAYVGAWCSYQNKSPIRFAECAWSEFINDFPLHAIRHLRKDEHRYIRDVLIQKGVFVQSGRSTSLKAALEKLLESVNMSSFTVRNVTKSWIAVFR